ncbi:MAG: HAD hydrolase family protein [Muribaculaceae bacterium]|nr:HAD hydrolase family protein [Muribaculaceae bacterium]
MSTLFVSDMDGTLLGSDSRVSEFTAETISRLSRQGALITVATARTPATVVPLLAETYTSVPAIVMTGAALWNRRTASYEEVHFIPCGLESVVERECAAAGICPFVYTLPDDGRGVMQVFHGESRLNHIEDAFYQERRALALKHFNLGQTAPDSLSGRRILYFAMGPRDGIYAAGRRLAATTSCAISYYPDIFNPELALLEVFAPGVSKAAAIRSLRKRVGADRLVVFGDNLNDLSMLAVADEGVAVENALPEVKAAATRVIGPNTLDSVAKYILSEVESGVEASLPPRFKSKDDM